MISRSIFDILNLKLFQSITIKSAHITYISSGNCKSGTKNIKTLYISGGIVGR